MALASTKNRIYYLDKHAGDEKTVFLIVLHSGMRLWSLLNWKERSLAHCFGLQFGSAQVFFPPCCRSRRLEQEVNIKTL